MTKKKDHTPFILKVIRWYFPKLEWISQELAARYFMKLFLTPIRYKPPVKELVVERLAKKSKYRIGNKQIQFYCWGQEADPYVLLVHGWAGRATQFRKFIPVFTQAGYRVIGFDGPAHGQSEGTSTNILEFEAVFHSIVEKWGVPEAIIAHSFGGAASLFSISKGLPVKKQINIASPVIANEVIKTFLKAINGSWPTALIFKERLKSKYGMSFDETTSEITGMNLPTDLKILIIHDKDDREVEMVHPKRFEEVFPSANTFYTKGLGHNRILKDESVIKKCLEFVNQRNV